MQILILGSSSAIGSALAAQFAPGNSLILSGRDEARLAATEGACREAGASRVTCVVADLAEGIEALHRAIAGLEIDLIIDVASASSGKRDAEIAEGEMAGMITADFLSKIALIDVVLEKQGTAPALIFISSVLTLVKSPGRIVYTSLKALHEVYLRKVAEKRPAMRLMVVHVGAVIETTRASEKAQKLARSVAKAFAGGRRSHFFGLSGRLYLGLYYLQPLIFLFAANSQRRLRRIST